MVSSVLLEEGACMKSCDSCKLTEDSCKIAALGCKLAVSSNVRFPSGERGSCRFCRFLRTT